MKRMIYLAALTLLPCFGIASVCSSPVRADGGVLNRNAETRIRIDLTGKVILGLTPKGHAESRAAGTQRQLNVEVEKVNMADGSVLIVKVGSAAVGMLTLKLGHGEVDLNTKNGALLPAVQKGTVVTVVTAAGAVVESGTF
jgi:hypothetical protein